MDWKSKSAIAALLLMIVALPVGIILVRRSTIPPSSKAAGEAVDMSFTPASITMPSGQTVSLWLDAKTNKVGFIRLDLRFDQTKFQLAGEIIPTTSFTQLRQITSMASANSTGQIAILLGSGPGEVYPTGRFLVAQFQLTAVTVVPLQSAQMTLYSERYTNGGWKTPQVIDTTITPTVALDFTFTPLVVNLNPLPTPTPTLIPTSTPTPRPPTPTPTPTATPTPTPRPPTPTPTPTATPTPTPRPPTPTPTPTATPTPTPRPPTPTPTPTATPTPTPLPKPGDGNGDGKVDGQDYVIWLNHYTLASATQCPCEGDYDKNGVVDGRDYIVWLVNYGK